VDVDGGAALEQTVTAYVTDFATDGTKGTIDDVAGTTMTISLTLSVSTLVHNSDRMGTCTGFPAYDGSSQTDCEGAGGTWDTTGVSWAANWGKTGGQYGEFTCDTCHQSGSTNIKRIIETAHETAVGILESHRDQLHMMAEALVRYETIDGRMIDQIMQGKEPDPPEDWDDSTSDSVESESGAKDSDDRPPIGGPAEQV